VDPGVRNRLNKSAKDLRLAKLIASVERFEIRRIEFAGKPLGATPLVLTQGADGKWKETTADGKAIDAKSEKVRSLLDRLSGNRIQEFIALQAAPKGEADGLRVTLTDEKGAKKRELVFWQAGGKLYARDRSSSASGRAEAFGVDTAIRDALPWDRNFFR
jgi:hypothetical protein